MLLGLMADLPLAANPYRLWPAVAVTIITGIGFASIKFVLIAEQALAFDASMIQHLPFEWMREVMAKCSAQNLTKEAITQGLAAVLTTGVLLGYVVNCPLAGAWRAAPMFVLSCLFVAVACLLSVLINVWIIALVIGIGYGAACAARGKVVPLLAEGTGRHNAFVSGVINASLVIGLLMGTLIGLGLAAAFVGSADKAGIKPAWAGADTQWLGHLAVAAIFAVGVLFALRLRTPSCPVVPFGAGMRSLAGDTWGMFRRHWALLVSGGIIWGIAAAASLAVLVWSITEVHLDQVVAGTISVFGAVGAIIGNLVSDKLNRRRWAICCLVGLAVAMILVPVLLLDYGSVALNYSIGAAMMVVVGAMFAAPANIVDARLLHQANREGLPGRGSTVMSLIHNLFILLVGVGLAIPLFLSLITAAQQFWILAGFAVAAAVITLFTELRDDPASVADVDAEEPEPGQGRG